MAGIGLRKPYYAIYHYNESTGEVTYTRGGVLAKAIEFSASVESGDDNNLWADDGIAESDRSFGGGTVSITTDDLAQEASAAILGITPREITIGGASTPVMELVYDEEATAPYLGFGVIIPKKKNSKIIYRAVVLPKIMFSVPEDAAKTMQDSIEWQTPTIEGTILRSDALGHPWKREVTVASEAEAVAYIKQCLQITEAPALDKLGELTVTSAAGAAAGNTKLTVTPAKASGNSYKYKTGASVTLPVYDESCTTGFTAWDGAADITAATGQKILLVETDSAGKAKAAGIATVTAKA